MSIDADDLIKAFEALDLMNGQYVEEVAEKNEKRLDKEGDPYYETCERCAAEHRQLAGWLKELKQLREQTRWIPVSERLPEICQEDCHGNITFSKTVLTTQIYGDGYVYVGIDKYTTNNGGGWLTEVPFDNPEECCKVIAWMPLPEPMRMEKQ